MEEQIKKIIKEQVETYLIDNILLEYAFPRKDFIKQVDNLLPQIIIHWCLIRYNRILDKTDTIQHWKKELLTWFSRIMKLTLKGNDSVETRKKAIQEVISLYDYNNNVTTIKYTILPKFNDEGIQLDNNDAINEVINQFFDEIEHIIDVLANKNLKELYQYLENL